MNKISSNSSYDIPLIAGLIGAIVAGFIFSIIGLCIQMYLNKKQANAESN